MRFLLGIILGAFLTIGAAYLYDNQNKAVAAGSQPDVQRSLVNWDVVSRKWDQLTDRARGEWTRLAG